MEMFCGKYLSWVLLLLSVFIIQGKSQRPQNPTILQDSRDLPTPEGYFGFLYRTEDGIAHGARGDPSGQVHGRFTYTDPTGLKVNFNYNAGSRATPGYKYNDAPRRQPVAPAPQVEEYEQPKEEAQRPLLAASKTPVAPLRSSSYPDNNNNYDNYYDQPRRNYGRNSDYYDNRNRYYQQGRTNNDVDY